MIEFVGAIPRDGPQTDRRWDNDLLNELKELQGSDFEAVDTASLQLDADSGQVRPPNSTPRLHLYLPHALSRERNR